MQNWLGQELLVGSTVYRGARQGNSSEFKVGTILSFKGHKATVEWKYGYGFLWEWVDRGAKWSDGSIRHDRDFVAYVPGKLEGKGSPGIDTLVVLPDSDLLRLDAVYALVTEWKDRLDNNRMTKEEFLDRMSKF